MPRRRSLALASVTLAAAGLSAGCDGDASDNGCELEQQMALAGTALTLLPSARLDQVAGGFFLLGNDASAVRWEALAADGTPSTEQAFALPDGVVGPLYAAAGAAVPGDTILVGWVTAGTGGANELDVIAVPADGSASAAPAAKRVSFPAGSSPPSMISMLSSRAGMNAGLVWVDPQTNQVTFATLDGSGELLANPVVLASSTPTGGTSAITCLGFSPGKDALTVSYLEQSTDASGHLQPSAWTIVEATEAGGVDSTLVLNIPGQTTCAIVAPTDTGYALAWQDDQGGWIATGNSQTVSAAEPFVSASSFGGPDLQPPLVGIAQYGADLGVALERPADVELWRLDSNGERRPGALVFPSLAGQLGDVSAVPVAGTLVATYADYSSPAGSPTRAGRRLFVDAVCY